MLTLLVTVLVVLAGVAASHAVRIGGAAARAVFAGATVCAIIVAVETVLGGLGLLSRNTLAGTVVLVCAAVGSVSVLRIRGDLSAFLRDDYHALRDALALLRHPEVAGLGLTVVVAFSWVITAAIVLPPRAVDGLAHHLPPVFEAAARGQFSVLPVQVTPWYAYPLNADLLMLWPAVLDGGIRFIDLAQVATSLLAMFAVIALASEGGASHRRAACAGLVFLLCPVVLRQAGACYTDVTIAAFFGVAAVGVARFVRSGGPGALLLCGIGFGLLAGTKYHMLFSILILLPLLMVGILRQPSQKRWSRFALLFVLPATLLSCYWYARNFTVLGNPFFPYQVGLGPLTWIPGSLPRGSELVGSGPLILAVLRKPILVLRLALLDPGLGSVDGGLGPAIWGAALPLSVWLAFRASVLFCRERDPGCLTIAVPFIAGLAPYAVTHEVTMAVTARFLLCATIPALAFFAVSFTSIDARAASLARLATGGAALLAAVGVLQMGGDETRNERKQFMSVASAVDLRTSNAPTSPWRLLEGASYGLNDFAPVWNFVDLVSAPPGEPTLPLWICATGRYVAPLYGSQLQNRLWNSPAPGRPPEPDAYVYTFSYFTKPAKIEYFGESVPLKNVSGQPDRFEAVFVTPGTIVYFRRSLLEPGSEVRRRIVEYYKRSRPELIAEARKLASRLDGGVVLAVDQLGIGLKALEMTGQLHARVILLTDPQVNQAITEHRSTSPVWIVGSVGASSLPIVETLSIQGREVALYAVPRGTP